MNLHLLFFFSSLKTPPDPDEDSLYKELDNVCSKVCNGLSCKSSPRIKSNFTSQDKGCFCSRNSFCKEVHSSERNLRDYKIEARDASAINSVTGGGRQTSVSREGGSNMSEDSESVKDTTHAPVWCMDCQNNLIVVGCANGQIEIWEASSGKHKVSTVLIICNFLLLALARRGRRINPK